MVEEDRYADMTELFAANVAGRDYRIHRRAAESDVAIVAPHGGSIEPGTFEIADAVAGHGYNFYCFEAITDGLHVTSHHFDDPDCIRLVETCGYVVAVHGSEDSVANGRPDLTVAIGGRDMALGAVIRQELEQGGFAIGDSSRFPGTHKDNICNRGRRRMGVQLEISRSLRDSLVKTMPEGTGGLFSRFAFAIRRTIQNQIARN